MKYFTDEELIICIAQFGYPVESSLCSKCDEIVDGINKILGDVNVEKNTIYNRVFVISFQFYMSC